MKEHDWHKPQKKTTHSCARFYLFVMYIFVYNTHYVLCWNGNLVECYELYLFWMFQMWWSLIEWWISTGNSIQIHFIELRWIGNILKIAHSNYVVTWQLDRISFINWLTACIGLFDGRKCMWKCIIVKYCRERKKQQWKLKRNMVIYYWINFWIACNAAIVCSVEKQKTKIKSTDLDKDHDFQVERAWNVLKMRIWWWNNFELKI